MPFRTSIFVAALLATAAACGESESTGGGGTGGSGGSVETGGAPQMACDECDRILAPYCAASGTCSTSQEGDDCAWGAIGSWTDCDSEQAFTPTSLPLDCRLPRNHEDPRCENDITFMPAGSIGSGTNSLYFSYAGGFIDAANGRVVYAFACDICDPAETGVIAVDLATGDRTLLSGQYVDSLDGLVSVGVGEMPSSLGDVHPGPGGTWIGVDNVYGAAEIYEIDPATGDRTVVYQQDALDAWATPICMIGDVGLDVAQDVWTMPQRGWGNIVVEPDGTIYARAEHGEPRIYGIVALKDGACTVVSAYSDAPEYVVGAGTPLRDYLPWLVDDGDRLLFNDQYILVAIDKATGQRTALSSAMYDAPLGDGPEMGNNFAALSADGTKLFTNGPYTDEAQIVVDLATGNREVVAPIHAVSGDSDLDGPQLLHPTLDGVLVIALNGGVLLFEPATGNYNNLSR